MADLEKIREALQDRVVMVVADRAGLSRVTVAAIKKGEAKSASKKTLNALAAVLGVDDDDG